MSLMVYHFCLSSPSKRLLKHYETVNPSGLFLASNNLCLRADLEFQERDGSGFPLIPAEAQLKAGYWLASKAVSL